MFLAIVSYDVSTKTPEGRRRLRQVARACEDYGQRVQNSVFECWVSNESFLTLRKRVVDIMNAGEDSVRIYFLGEQWKGRIEHLGVKSVLDPQGPLIL
jgi:CRISPR-associated protein Cas2